MKKTTLVLLITTGFLTAEGKTVGDLLKQANRGGGTNLSNEKSKQILSISNQDDQPIRKNNIEQIRPAKTNVFQKTGDDNFDELEKQTDEQIGLLFQMTQKLKGSPQRGELWLRLAELYVERAGYIDQRKTQIYENQMKAYNEKKTTVKPTLDLSDAKDFNKKAVQLYEWFVRDFPKDSKKDQAMFFLGYNYFELEDFKKGTDYYQRLVKEHPRSNYVQEAYFALGEYYFENEKFAQALENYLNVAANQTHRLYSYAIYKVAWCYYRLGDSNKALAFMERLVSGATKNAAKGKNKLENEGLRDLVLFYADVSDATQAPAYFARVAGPEADKYLEKLAFYYADKGNVNGSKMLFNNLIAKNPTSAKAIEMKHQLIVQLGAFKNSKEYRDELFSFVKDFGVNSAWYATNKGNKEIIDNSFKLRESALKKYILHHHQTAQNTRLPLSQTLAYDGYRIYFTELGANNPNALEMHFYFAELCYDLKKFEEASTHYKAVVDFGEPNNKYFAQAIDNIIYSLEKDLPTDDELAKAIQGKTEPIPLDPRVERFIKAATPYMSKLKDPKKRSDIEFRVGRLYYQHNQFDEALKIFQNIVKVYPESKNAEFSANLILDIYNIKKDYVGLEKAAKELLGVKGFAGSKAANDVQGVLEKASFKKGQDLEGQKKYGESAAAYKAFSLANAGSELALKAMFNAAINFERAGLLKDAVEAHQLFQASPKASPQQKLSSAKNLAQIYNDSYQYEKAAQSYRKLASDFPTDPLATNYHFNSALLFLTLGQTKEAEKEYLTYFNKEKKPERVETFYQLGSMYERQKQKAAMISYFKQYINSGGGKPDNLAEAHMKIFQTYLDQKNYSEVEEWKRKAQSYLSRAAIPGDLKNKYLAQIQLYEAQVVFAELLKIKIPADPASQGAAVQKKVGLLNKLTGMMTDVAKAKSIEEVIKGLNTVGVANHHMADAIMSTPLPAGLSAEESAQYKKGIQGLAEPYLKKAKDYYKLAWKKATDEDTYTDAAHIAFKNINLLEKGTYYDGAEKVLE